MAAFTNFAENKLIDFLFRNQQLGIGGSTVLAGISNLHIGLLTADPTETGTATSEVGSGIGYARVAVANSLANWKSTQNNSVASTGTSGTTSNTNAIQFGAPTGNWGTIGWFGIFDAATGGNMIIYGQLNNSKGVSANDAAPSFAIDALSFTIDN